MRDEYNTWILSKLGEKCVQNLTRNGFDAYFFGSRTGAVNQIMQLAEKFNTFGFGGSETVRSLGLVELIRKKAQRVYDHWESGLSSEEDLRRRLEQGRCDCFICSANAISVDGEIVNVDGVGNRTNAMTFGCKQVIIVAGMNKITHSLEEAVDRIKKIAAPMRAKSLNMKTPCAETGFCNDCNSPQRICRITAILHRNPLMTNVSVILIKDSLGF